MNSSKNINLNDSASLNDIANSLEQGLKNVCREYPKSQFLIFVNTNANIANNVVRLMQTYDLNLESNKENLCPKLKYFFMNVLIATLHDLLTKRKDDLQYYLEKFLVGKNKDYNEIFDEKSWSSTYITESHSFTNSENSLADMITYQARYNDLSTTINSYLQDNSQLMTNKAAKEFAVLDELEKIEKDESIIKHSDYIPKPPYQRNFYDQ